MILPRPCPAKLYQFSDSFAAALSSCIRTRSSPDPSRPLSATESLRCSELVSRPVFPLLAPPGAGSLAACSLFSASCSSPANTSGQLTCIQDVKSCPASGTPLCLSRSTCHSVSKNTLIPICVLSKPAIAACMRRISQYQPTSTNTTKANKTYASHALTTSQRQKLSSCGRIIHQQPSYRRSRRPHARRSHASCRHTHMLCSNNHNRPLRL